MRQIFLSILLAVTAVVSLTFGGMAFVNHEGGMMMFGDGCMRGVCAMTPGTGMEDPSACISHCLQAATVDGTIPMSASVQLIVLLAVTVFATFYSRSPEFLAQFFRSENHIGKLLLQRQLSTVIIRD